MGANQSCEAVERVTEVADFDFREEEEAKGNAKSWMQKDHKSWGYEHKQQTLIKS